MHLCACLLPIANRKYRARRSYLPFLQIIADRTARSYFPFAARPFSSSAPAANLQTCNILRYLATPSIHSILSLSSASSISSTSISSTSISSTSILSTSISSTLISSTSIYRQHQYRQHQYLATTSIHTVLIVSINTSSS